MYAYSLTAKKYQLFNDYTKYSVLDVILIITVSTNLTNGLTSEQIDNSILSDLVRIKPEFITIIS